MLRCIQALCCNPLCCVWFVALHCVAIRCVTVVLYLSSCVVEMFSISSIPSMLCTGQIKASTSPPPGISRAFDCNSCLGRGEIERCFERVGNLNQIYLLF